MYNPPEMKKYKSLVSATIISVLAVLLLLFGVIVLIAGIANSSSSKSDAVLGLTGTSLGITMIVSSAFLFVISNIAEDIHFQTYLKDYSLEEMQYYHDVSLYELESIKNLLSEQQGAQPTPTDQAKPVKEPIKQTSLDR